MAVIALLSDFGYQDWYVGAVKGAICGIAGRVDIVDITHGVPMGDIRAGAYALLSSYRSFPKGTIFVAVVDPGVGSSRLGLIARAGDYVFVGPDNGLLAPCLALDKHPSVRRLTNPNYQRSRISPVFHGRDIFAPAAAHMARGASLNSFGAEVKKWVSGPFVPARTLADRITGTICYIDHFGNALSSILLKEALAVCGKHPVVRVRGRRLPLKFYYDEVARGKPLAVGGSAGYIEVAVNDGSAARKLGLRVGTTVSVTRTTKR